MFGYDGDHLSAWGWFGMVAGMMLFWGMVITAIVRLVRSLSRSDTGQATSPTPAQLLAVRFARGEIDEP